MGKIVRIKEGDEIYLKFRVKSVVPHLNVAFLQGFNGMVLNYSDITNDNVFTADRDGFYPVAEYSGLEEGSINTGG